jgi:hypothetical protein
MLITNTSPDVPTSFHIARIRHTLAPGESVNISNNYHEEIRVQCNSIPHLVADWFEGENKGKDLGDSKVQSTVSNVNSKKVTDTLEYLTETKANKKNVYTKEESDKQLAKKADVKTPSVDGAIAIINSDGSIGDAQLKPSDLEHAGKAGKLLEDHVKADHSTPPAGTPAKEDISRGTTAKRPKNCRIGTFYFDQTLKLPIWWEGKMWVDASGSKT